MSPHMAPRWLPDEPLDEFPRRRRRRTTRRTRRTEKTKTRSKKPENQRGLGWKGSMKKWGVKTWNSAYVFSIFRKQLKYPPRYLGCGQKKIKKDDLHEKPIVSDHYGVRCIN